MKPTRMILQGDKELAATHAGDAKRMLFQLKNIQSTNATINELTKRYEDGTVINVHTKVDGMDVVTIESNRWYSKEKEEEKYKEEEFPVPIISLSDDIDNLDCVGAYVAERFIGRFSEYIETTKDEIIKYNNGDISLKELESVGITPSSPFFNGIVYGCVSAEWTPPHVNDTEEMVDDCETEYENKPCEDCDGGVASVGCECRNICPACSEYVDGFCLMGIKFGCYWGKTWYKWYHDEDVVYGSWGFTTCTGGENLAGRYLMPYAEYWPCPSGNNFPTIPGPKGRQTGCQVGGTTDNANFNLLLDTLGIGSYGNKATQRSSSSTYHGWQDTIISISGTDCNITGRWDINGSGTTVENYVAGTFGFTSNYSRYGNKLEYIDSKYWEDTKDYVCLYCDVDVGMDSINGGTQGCLPGSGGYISPGISFATSDYTANNRIKITTTTKTFTLHELQETIDIFPYYDGGVAVFNYNGKPFYMYRLVYIESEYDSEGYSYDSTHWNFEYGCIYKDKINKIRFKGIGDDVEWAHSMDVAEYENNDGIKRDITLTKEVLSLFGGFYIDGLPLRAGKYTVKYKVQQ